MRELRDPIEAMVAASLTKVGIRYEHEPDETCLDFYLPDFGVHIECKQFYSERCSKQLQRVSEVILIQGRTAAEAFCKMLEARP